MKPRSTRPAFALAGVFVDIAGFAVAGLDLVDLVGSGVDVTDFAGLTDTDVAGLVTADLAIAASVDSTIAATESKAFSHGSGYSARRAMAP